MKLSLVAELDEMVRKNRVLMENLEPDFLEFVNNQEECRVHWLESKQEVSDLTQQLEDMKQKNYTLEIRYEHAREQIKHESQAREKSEIARADKENQLMLIRDLVSDPNREINREQLDYEISRVLPRRSHSRRASSYGGAAESSASVLDDVDWDYTDDDILDSPTYGSSHRQRKRPSAPPQDDVFSDKKNKRHRQGNDVIDVDVKNNSFVSQTTIRVNENGEPVEASTTVYPNTRLNKSFSETALNGPRLSQQHHNIESDTDEGSPWMTPNTNASNLRGILRNKNIDPVGTPNTPGLLRKAASTGKGLNKTHIFISRKIVISETCSVCDKKVKFGRILKCQGCSSTVHPECKEQLDAPCIPLPTGTPGKGKMVGKLGDFVPLTPPMIPALVVHCVQEVERRGLQEVGLYRVSGSDKQVRELKDKFYRGKGLPNLSQVTDIHVVCSVLKEFLCKLKEPVITYKLWNEFAKAAEHPHKSEAINQLCDVINRLPQPNRDTLAFIMLHLHKVATSPECMMPVTNLSTIFGVSIVGNSSANPQPTAMFDALPKQAMITEQLLNIPLAFWSRFVDNEICEPYASRPNTPGDDDLCQSRLGPLITTPDAFVRNRAFSVGTKPTTTSNMLAAIHKRQRHFDSPIIMTNV